MWIMKGTEPRLDRREGSPQPRQKRKLERLVLILTRRSIRDEHMMLVDERISPGQRDLLAMELCISDGGCGMVSSIVTGIPL